MRKTLNIVLAAATLGGALLATAAPAAAQEWRRDGWHDRGDRHWRDRDYDRDRDRDRHWRGYYNGGWGRDCVAQWRWSRYWHRYVRVTACY
jgi:hypothetical protein